MGLNKTEVNITNPQNKSEHNKSDLLNDTKWGYTHRLAYPKPKGGKTRLTTIKKIKK